MNSEERPATSWTAYMRIINILFLHALSKRILQILGAGIPRTKSPSPYPLPQGEVNTGCGCLGNQGGRAYAQPSVREENPPNTPAPSPARSYFLSAISITFFSR